ncbi:MAG TPA: hypothetical protein VES97_13125, partial [Solirubrobacteraceae bacterium]|nr:hypothetical protein [Solirubrobacteraceae bacterium]
MQSRSSRLGRLAPAAIGALLAAVALAPAAGAHMMVRARTVTVKRMVVKVPEARNQKKAETVTIPQVGKIALNREAIIKIRPKGEPAPNVLVLEPGTSAAAAYFVPFAR